MYKQGILHHTNWEQWNILIEVMWLSEESNKQELVRKISTHKMNNTKYVHNGHGATVHVKD